MKNLFVLLAAGLFATAATASVPAETQKNPTFWVPPGAEHVESLTCKMYDEVTLCGYKLIDIEKFYATNFESAIKEEKAHE